MSYRNRGASPFQSHAIASKTLARRTLGQKINKEDPGAEAESRGGYRPRRFEEGQQPSGSGHRVPSLRRPAEFSAEVTLKLLLLHGNEKSSRTGLI